MKKSCKGCKFWTSNGEGTVLGICKRFPVWHECGAKHYCWEFKAPPKKKEKAEPYMTSKPKRTMNLWEDIYSEIMGRKPFLNPADRSAAGRLAQEFDLDTLEFVFKSFLSEPPRWNRENHRYDLRFLPSIVNAILARQRDERSS